MDKIMIILENIPNVYNSIMAWIDVNAKCTELRAQLLRMRRDEQNMIMLLKVETTNPCKIQKNIVGTFFEHVASFRDEADKLIKQCEERGKLNHILMVEPLDQHLEKGQVLLSKADQLMKEGLTRDELYTRGMRLPVEKLIGNTANKIRTEALLSIRRRGLIIGIHGNCGAGKTNLMKFLHNDVFDDHEQFKAVIWAGVSQEQRPDVKSIQDCVAKAMQFKLEDEDVVRRSGLLSKRLKDMAPGHVVLFLDNVREQFLTCEVGIPVGCYEAENFFCTLIFTTTSESICNRMCCSVRFKMDVLPKDEARELFLHEAGWNNDCTRSYGRRMQKVANDVAMQCAHMPLVITQIARSMTGKDDICEWNNCLNELKGFLESMNEDEARILEQLQFSFNCIKDRTIRGFFLDSASILLEGHQLTRQELIQRWVQKGRICKKRRKGASPTAPAIYDQGHTIINELHRAYLLEAVELDGIEYVRMNKWVRKMAGNIPPKEEEALP